MMSVAYDKDFAALWIEQNMARRYLSDGWISCRLRKDAAFRQESAVVPMVWETIALERLAET